MVVEHTFVTTLPPAEAMRRASEFLALGGFAVSPTAGRAFAVDGAGQWTTLAVVRGKPKAAAARRIVDLPQQVQLEWDRGRVTAAASIADRFSVERRRQLLFAVVSGLDQLLVQQVTPTAAAAAWLELDRQLHRRVFNLVRLTVLAVFLTILFVRLLPLLMRLVSR